MKKMMDSTTVIITTTDNRVLLQKRDENPDIELSLIHISFAGSKLAKLLIMNQICITNFSFFNL